MGENMIREPAVAGAFYESNVKYLRESIEDCFKHRLGPGEVPKLSRINKEKQVNAIMVPLMPTQSLLKMVILKPL